MKTFLLLLLLSSVAFADERVKQVSLSITAEQNALSTTAEIVAAADQLRHSCTVKNLDAAIIIYVGPAGVTSANGMSVAAGASIMLKTTGPVYAVAASGTPTVAILNEVER